MSYLEDYLEKIVSVPIDVNRCLRLIREVDNRFQVANARLEELQHTYLSMMKNAKDKKQETQKQENQALLDEIRALQEECLSYCRFKVDIATQSYDVLEQNVERLEGDLKKFEEEMKHQQEEMLPAQDDYIAKDIGKRTSMSKLGSKYAKSKSKTEGKLAASQSMNLENLENSNTPKESNEPRYCICNGVSYGDMIKCDNPYCEKEWFHFFCMGLTSKPKGRWYCKDCRALKNKDMLKF